MIRIILIFLVVSSLSGYYIEKMPPRPIAKSYLSNQTTSDQLIQKPHRNPNINAHRICQKYDCNQPESSEDNRIIYSQYSRVGSYHSSKPQPSTSHDQLMGKYKNYQGGADVKGLQDNHQKRILTRIENAVDNTNKVVQKNKGQMEGCYDCIFSRHGVITNVANNYDKSPANQYGILIRNSANQLLQSRNTNFNVIPDNQPQQSSSSVAEDNKPRKWDQITTQAVEKHQERGNNVLSQQNNQQNEEVAQEEQAQVETTTPQAPQGKTFEQLREEAAQAHAERVNQILRQQQLEAQANEIQNQEQQQEQQNQVPESPETPNSDDVQEERKSCQRERQQSGHFDSSWTSQLHRRFTTLESRMTAHHQRQIQRRLNNLHKMVAPPSQTHHKGSCPCCQYHHTPSHKQPPPTTEITIEKHPSKSKTTDY